MIAELGHFALVLALAASLAQAFLLLAGAGRGNVAWMAAGRHAAIVHAGLVAASFAALAVSFLANDFAVKAVAAHSHSALPAAYRIAAIWAGHEGSMLLWVLALAFWTASMRVASARLPLDLACRALGLLGLVSSGFLVLVIATANPFARLLAAPPDGRDLNPVLQDPGMLLQFPLLAAGGAGFGVAFALGLAALLDGRLDAAWARWSRPWTLAAWTSLTLGIAVGSLWARREPQWGGWWSWDPVEIGALLPWLAGTALVHSLAVTEKRGLFRRWTVLLAILAFALALLGVFLARSGLLPGARPFASDPRSGAPLLALLALVAGGSALVFARRGGTLDGHGHFEMISREAALLANNAVLLSALGAVVFGALYPIVMEALGAGRTIVGPPYFDSVFAPLLLPGLALLGPGPRFRWGAEAPDEALRDAVRPALAAVAAAIVAGLATDRSSGWVVTGMFCAVWISWHTLEAVAFRWRRTRLPGARAHALPTATFYAMHLAHFGVAVFIAGVTLSQSGTWEADVVLAPGVPASVGPVRLRAEGTRAAPGPNYRAVRLRVVVEDGGRETVLEPEARLYRAGGMRTAQAAIDSAISRDVIVALGEPAGGGAWTVRVQVKPFMSFVWLGLALAALGGAAAAFDRRYRASVRARADGDEPSMAWAGKAAP